MFEQFGAVPSQAVAVTDEGEGGSTVSDVNPFITVDQALVFVASSTVLIL